MGEKHSSKIPYLDRSSGYRTKPTLEAKTSGFSRSVSCVTIWCVIVVVILWHVVHPFKANKASVVTNYYMKKDITATYVCNNIIRIYLLYLS